MKKTIILMWILITFIIADNNIDKDMDKIISRYGVYKSAKIIAKEFKKELPKKIDNIVTTEDIEANKKTLIIKKSMDDNSEFFRFIMSDRDKWDKVKYYYILRDSYIACKNPMTYTYLLHDGNYEVDYFKKSNNNFLFKIEITKRDCDQFNRSDNSTPLERRTNEFQSEDIKK